MGRKMGMKKKPRNWGQQQVEAEEDPVPVAVPVHVHVSDLEEYEGGEEEGEEVSEKETRRLVMDERKRRGKKGKGGGFQAMGLCHQVLRAILKKGYKVPTPIQRKAIPTILEGRDVVAMARTGSGKTAAFLVPLFERLKCHSAKSGVRALILSPTRELAIQTYRFSKEMGRFMDLKAVLILGGDRMESQFAAMHANPDIVVATPGRLLHVLVEMNLRLTTVEYMVFDEADRLFEMGFQEQLHEIINRLPDHRQTLLFSATLPQLLVEFAKAGLNDPQLIRLDTDSKLSENLKTAFICCRDDDKAAVLVHLLKSVLKPGEMTAIFVATRHHVEYLRALLSYCDIECTYVYSNLDPEARKSNIMDFRSRRVTTMIVTDVAARGIDIPFLDNVVNYNFPSKAKLFVHRVGRVARAGRSGTAYSLVCPDEAPFLQTLHLFLDLPLKMVTSDTKEGTDAVCGSVPQLIIDEETDVINKWHETSVDLQGMRQVCSNAYKQYIKSRPAPSSESVKKAKTLSLLSLGPHPIYNSKDMNAVSQTARNLLLQSIKCYRPQSTIFEVNVAKKNAAFEVMQKKRKHHDKLVLKTREVIGHSDEVETASDGKGSNGYRDESCYISYLPENYETEKGLQVDRNAKTQLDEAVIDLVGDEEQAMKKKTNTLKWDRKRKRFVGDAGNKPGNKRIKTESGAWIPASYQSDLYKKWKNRSKLEQQSDSETEENQDQKLGQVSLNKFPGRGGRGRGRGGSRGGEGRAGGGGRGGKPPKRELKTKDEILKVRIIEEKKQKFMKWRESEKRKNQTNQRKGGKSSNKRRN